MSSPLEWKDYFINIERISRKKDSEDGQRIFNFYVDCNYRLNAVKIIHTRYHVNVQLLMKLDAQKQQIMNLHPTNVIRVSELNEQDRQTFNLCSQIEHTVRLDHESFILFSRILMDKIALLARTLIGDENLASRSFNAQKDWLKKLGSPYSRNPQYASLVKDETDWFDITLKLTRDEFIVHGSPRIMATGFSREGNFTMTSMTSPGYDIKYQEALIKIKRKHEINNPELMKVPDNLWEILRYIQNHDLKLV